MTVAEPRDRSHGPDVELSIVIPTRNRPGMLRRCISAVVGQTGLTERLELVVVVDGADPVTEQMLGSLELPFPLRVVVQEHARQAAARNRGVSEAKGQYVLFLDDDVVAQEGLVAAHLAALRGGDSVVAIGRIDRHLPSRSSRWLRARERGWQSHYDRLAAGRKVLFSDCYGGNLALGRSAFLDIGGFDLDLVPEEDVEFGHRAEQAGMRLVYVPDAVACEEEHETLRQFMDDARVRGQKGVLLYERHPALLPHLRLGGARDLPRRWIALRRLLLLLRLPPTVPALAVRLTPTESAAAAWLAFLFAYCHSIGVRETVDRDTWRRLRQGTAILMYHAIGRPGERAARYVLPVKRFRRQLGWLKARRYTVIGLDEFVRCRLEHRLPPAKSVVLTFDDGYCDIVELALPALQRHAFPATVFLVSAAGGQAAWDRAAETRERPILEPAAAAKLNDVFRFGAHSRTHPSLPKLDAVDLAREIAGCRAELEAALGTPVSTFAYPYGETSPEVETAVRDAGFLAACGVAPGRNRPACELLALRRLEIRGTDSLFRFALTLWLGDTRMLRRRRRVQ
jgi:peptidoglycan/xylan/chitin deacetylase (PgdA/CDA1 family)/GT2 family glycosyltransferase